MSVELSRRCCVCRGDQTMKAWPKEELRKIAETDDLHIAPFREDGETYGTPTWIWSVVVDDALYVRGYNGQKSRWYQAAGQQQARTLGHGEDCAARSADLTIGGPTQASLPERRHE